MWVSVLLVADCYVCTHFPFPTTPPTLTNGKIKQTEKQEDYAERYRMELALYDRAERYLKEHLGSDTTLKLKAWKAEVATLTNEKDRLYREVRKLREKVSETETIKRCIEQAIEPQEQRKEQTKRRNIEL